MSEYASQLLRRIEAIDTAAADNRRRTEAYQQMAGELKEVTGRASSSDGVVTVVAGPGGEVREITFAEQTRTIAPAALAAAVMHTIAAAQVAATRQQAEVVRRGLGDTDLLDRVIESDQRLFGDQRPADPGPAPQPASAPRRPQPAHEDDFFQDFNVFGGGSSR